MEIRVNIPDELAAQAQARGLRLEVYVEELLAQQVASHPVEVGQPRTPEQIRAWLDSLAQFSDKIPPSLIRSRANGSTRTTIRWPFPRA